MMQSRIQNCTHYISHIAIIDDSSSQPQRRYLNHQQSCHHQYLHRCDPRQSPPSSHLVARLRQAKFVSWVERLLSDNLTFLIN